MTTWITGANGFIGRHLARALTAAGHVVHGIGHGAMPESERRHWGVVEWVNGEIDTTNLQALASQASEPDLIYHLAGGSSVSASFAQPHEDFVRTVGTTARLLEWVRVSAPKCRLVVASSAAVYGSAHTGPIPVGAPTAPMSPYGRHKLMMEQLCENYASAYDVQSTAVRLFSVYGPLLRKQLLWDLCMRLRGGAPVLKLDGTGNELRDWTEVQDVARLLLRVGAQEQQEPFRILNGGSGVGTSVRTIAETVAAHWGSDIRVQFSGTSRIGDPFSLVSGSSGLRELNFQWQTLLTTGVRVYVDWFKGHLR